MIGLVPEFNSGAFLVFPNGKREKGESRDCIWYDGNLYYRLGHHCENRGANGGGRLMPTITRLNAALIAACVTLTAVGISVGTHIAPSHIRTVTHTIIRNHIPPYTMPECGSEDANGIDRDDNCFLPADLNDSDNKQLAGKSLVIRDGYVYVYWPDPADD